ncbi:unnamed protein product [Mytilus coruscus]|uniref:Uncharacterized protein n=1 Tax=Mytilus coruscus TaxID=42192 RepID=A0A6J8AFV9_MYTCO|nr:unnamed protein product [Mytilus coruscus]
MSSSLSDSESYQDRLLNLNSDEEADIMKLFASDEESCSWFSAPCVPKEVKASREAEEEAKVKATEGEFPVSKEDTKEIISKKLPTIRELFTLVGMYALASNAVLMTPLYYRYHDIDKSKALKVFRDEYDATTILSVQAKQDIQSWIENLKHANGKIVYFG